MDPSGQAIETMVQYSIDGTRFALKVGGRGAKRLSSILRSAAGDQKKTMGKTRLKALLKSGKELTVFTVPDDRLKDFAREAKRYGVLYCVIREKKPRPGALSDILAKSEDAARISRILERLDLGRENILEDAPEVVTMTPNQQAVFAAEEVMEQMFRTPNDHSANPQTARTADSSPFAPSSGPSEGRHELVPYGMQSDPYARTEYSPDPEQRPSVRAALTRIKLEIERIEILEPDEFDLNQQISKILGKDK